MLRICRQGHEYHISSILSCFLFYDSSHIHQERHKFAAEHRQVPHISCTAVYFLHVDTALLAKRDATDEVKGR